MATTSEPPKVGDLLKHVGDDLKMIATTELELTRNKVSQYLDRTLLRASVIIIGAFIALIGLAMLCVVAVLAMQPVIHLLWVHLLMMSGVYMMRPPRKCRKSGEQSTGPSLPSPFHRPLGRSCQLWRRLPSLPM